MRKYRRRRGVYIHPVPVVLALLAGAAAAILCLRLLGGGGGTSPEEPPELPDDTPPPVREELPELYRDYGKASRSRRFEVKAA